MVSLISCSKTSPGIKFLFLSIVELKMISTHNRSGNKLGRIMGYPTANLEIGSANKLIPENGIYAVNVAIGKSTVNENSLFVPETGE